MLEPKGKKEVKCKFCNKIISHTDIEEEYIQCPYCGEIFEK